MYKLQSLSTFGFCIFLPLAFFFAPLIIALVCARPYPEAITTLRLLLISVFFVGANALRVQFLLICGRPDLYARLHIIAAIVGLPLIFILLYFLSYPGAALSTVITEVGIYLATTQLLKKSNAF